MEIRLTLAYGDASNRQGIASRMTKSSKKAAKSIKSASWVAVYESLRREILSLALKPGELLDETRLSQRFGCSRSPVREALIRLGLENLVVTLANRSAIVAPIDITRFPAYVDALDIAQRMNTRLAAELRTQSDIAGIETEQRAFIAAVAAKDHLAMSATNKDFHMAIARAGRNPYLIGFYDKLLDEGRRILHLHFDYIERTRDGKLLTDEHEEMIVAIRAHDVDRADKLALDHTRQLRDNFLAFLRNNYSTDIKL
jgi:DNA-binding GntR family transcriptional regulator